MNLADVQQHWGACGYYEGFAAYPEGSEAQIVSLLDERCPNTGVALEIGCGAGRWASQMASSHDTLTVYATDIIPRSEFLHPHVLYHQSAPKDFSLSQFGNETFDFIWCFGVLCHLPFEIRAECVEAAWHVLKPTGTAILMFGQRTRPELFEWHPILDEPIPWYHDTPGLSEELCQWAGFLTYRWNPAFRDTILICRKQPVKD